MRNILFLLISAALFVSCKTLDLTMSRPEEFRQLKDPPLIITTNEVVDFILKKDSIQMANKMLMEDMIITQFKLSGDSIIVTLNNYSSVIPFTNIKKIVCKGVYDDEIGFVSERELNKYIGEPNSLFATIGGGILGGGVGIAVGIIIWLTNIKTGNDLAIPLITLGAIGGGIIGNNIFTNYKINAALDKIKTQRLKK